MKVLKSILIFILALIITILICLVYITNLLNNTVLSKDYVLSKLDETDYYNQISIYIESNFEKYINQSGLDDDVVKNLITIENVKENTQKILNNMYDETQETINNEVLEQNLRNNIENYLNKNNLTPLHRAAANGSNKIGELLISKGAGINTKDIIYQIMKNHF